MVSVSSELSGEGQLPLGQTQAITPEELGTASICFPFKINVLPVLLFTTLRDVSIVHPQSCRVIILLVH